MRILRNMTFNETEMATFINIRNLSKITTLTTSTEITKSIEITEIIENASDTNDTDIADTNDANITLENIENAPFESIIVEPAPIRRSIRHRKATFKTVKANTVAINAIKIAEAPTTPTDEKESEKKNIYRKL
jgi:hypothetical protein